MTVTSHFLQCDTPRLRLWARSVGSKINDDLDNPPDVPVFRNETGLKKAAKKETLTDALTRVVIAFTNHELQFREYQKPPAY